MHNIINIDLNINIIIELYMTHFMYFTHRLKNIVHKPIWEKHWSFEINIKQIRNPTCLY